MLFLVIVSSSITLYAGGTIVLGRKFSARRFWNDCVDYKVTVFAVRYYLPTLHHFLFTNILVYWWIL